MCERACICLSCKAHVQYVRRLGSPFSQCLCCEGCFTVLHHHFSLPFFPMSHSSRETEEFAAALHLFSGCCLSVCFVLSCCVFKRQFLPARDTWKEPWHEQKTSPQRRGGGGGRNDNTRKETRPGNKLRLNRKTIKLQRWEDEEEEGKKTHRHIQQWKQIKQANRECLWKDPGEGKLQRMPVSDVWHQREAEFCWKWEPLLCLNDTIGCHCMRPKRGSRKAAVLLTSSNTFITSSQWRPCPR